MKLEILQLLEAVEHEDFKLRVDGWLNMGLWDVYSALRAWWAVRAAEATVESDGTIKLPPSYLSMITVFPMGGGRQLEPVTPEQAGVLFGGVGEPRYYLLEGLLMTLLPPQTEPYTARFTYYSSLEPIDQDADTSMYLNKAFSAVLYAAASHGAVYRGDTGLASMYSNAAVARIDAINLESAQARNSVGGVLMTRVR
jgi:hypothetical protein